MINCSVAARSPSVAGAGCCPAFDATIVRILNNIRDVVNSSPRDRRGYGDQCPVVPGLKHDDWPADDPKGNPLARIREVRDEIRQRVETLLEHEGWNLSA